MVVLSWSTIHLTQMQSLQISTQNHQMMRSFVTYPKFTQLYDSVKNYFFKVKNIFYLQNHGQMKTGKCADRCTSGEDEFAFKDDGITNGAAWYPINGGMQDWNYLQADCLGFTHLATNSY